MGFGMDRTAPSLTLRSQLLQAHSQAQFYQAGGPVPTEAARSLAASRTAAQRLALERRLGDAWRPGFDRPPPGIDQPDVGGNSFGRSRSNPMQRPQSAPPEWLERAGPNETPMSVRMANRERFLADAARQHSVKAGYGRSPTRGWMESLIEDTKASADFQNSVTPGQLAAMTGKGTGITYGPDGKFHRVRHHGPGHIGHERAQRGLPSRYGGFVPEHIRHDCVGAGAAHKIGSGEHARALRAACGMVGGRAAEAELGMSRPEMLTQSQRPSTGPRHPASASAGDGAGMSSGYSNRTPRGFASRLMTPRAPRGPRGARSTVNV